MDSSQITIMGLFSNRVNLNVPVELSHYLLHLKLNGEGETSIAEHTL